MRYLAALLLLISACLLAPASRAMAEEPNGLDECAVVPSGNRVNITYPALSPHGNLDFWRIPWKPGEKINGTLQLQTTAPVKNLTIRPVGGAASMDKQSSRNVILSTDIAFNRADVGNRPEDRTKAAETLYPAGTYNYEFSVQNIPGEDTYCLRLEATGELEDKSTFTQTLRSIKLKAFADAQMNVQSGDVLAAQWVNLTAPSVLLSPLEPLLKTSVKNYFSKFNPEPTVNITMPGTRNVNTTQEFSLQVSLDPALDENNNPTPYVRFWVETQDDSAPPLRDQPMLRQVTATGHETVKIHIYRTFAADDNQTGLPIDQRTVVDAPRIPPGKYHTYLRIRTDWGTEQAMRVELQVKDAPLWPGVVLVLGVLASLLASYWEKRQPLFQARQKAHRWRHYYLLQGMKLTVAEWTLERFNLAVSAGDVEGTTAAANLLEGMMRNLPGTLLLEGAVNELISGPNRPQAVLKAKVTTSPTVEAAIQALQAYCAADPDPGVQVLGKHLAEDSWHGYMQAPALAEVSATEAVRTWLERLGDLKVGMRRQATRLFYPSLWDTLVMLIFLVLINGGVLALQMVQVYGPNATFGSTGDYMSLIFWGFAGDTTRKKLTDLAGEMLPGGGKRAGAQPSTPNQAPAPAAAAKAPPPPDQSSRQAPPAP